MLRRTIYLEIDNIARHAQGMDGNIILFEAIAHRKMVRGVYNRGQVLIAPHIMYNKNDAVHIDAVTVERDGVPPRERRLATYRVSGLSELAIVDQQFDPEAEFDLMDERYQGTTLFAIETA